MHKNLTDVIKKDNTDNDNIKQPKHYIHNGIEPIDYIMTNGLDFCEGNVVKYISRWKHKNGVEDLKKARQYLDFLIDKQLES